MPIHQMNCSACGAELSYHSYKVVSASGERVACPYLGLAYAELRVGHDELYFGRWRNADATPMDVQRGYRQLERHLRAIGKILETEDLPAAYRDLEKAIEAFHGGSPGGEGPDALQCLDHALSYAHRVIDDLLHERGLPPHLPMDFAEWYDAGDVPFREDW